MKNIIIKSLLGVAFFAAVLVALPASASAAVAWNDGAYGPEAAATVTVGNATTNNCSTCWSSSTSASPGDVINVRIYYHNTGSSSAPNTIVRLNQPTGKSTTHSFSGSVSSSGVTSSGYATVNISSAQTLTFGSVRWYPDKSQSSYGLPNGQSGAEIFSSGLNLGTILPPCSGAGFCHQGSVVISFKVSQDVQQQCSITSFDPNPATVSSGSSSTLSWSTSSGCTSVLLSGGNIYGNKALNGSENTGPLYQTTSYTLTASGPTNTATSTKTVYVNQQPPQTYACNDGYDNDGDGYIDMNDPGCSSPTDNDEYNYVQPQTYACNDGYDNDGDGRIDMYDPGCSSPTDNDEYNYTQPQTYACNDGYDNDGDGYIDMNDPGCSSYTDNDEYNYTNYNNYPPAVVTNAATNVGDSGATLNGYVTSSTCSGIFCSWSNNTYTTYYFQYGTSSGSLYSQTLSQSLYGNSGSISALLTTLQPNTTYYFRAVATNGYGTSYGNVLSFVTGQGASQVSVITTAASNIVSGSARLNGLVSGTTANGGNVQAYFEYGTSQNLGLTTASRAVSSTSFINFFDTIATSPSTTYFFRAVANSNGVITRGSVLSFTTPGNTVIVQPTTTVVTPVVRQTQVTYGTGGGSPLLMLSINDQLGSVNLIGNGGLQDLGITGQLQNVFAGDTITYRIHYKNISTATLTNATLSVILPEGVTFAQSSQGVLTTNNTVVAPIGTLVPDAEGVIIIQGLVSPSVLAGANLVATATMAFTTPSGAQDSAVAYALNTVGSRANQLAGLALFGYGFFPTTLIGWIILLALILAIVLIARHYYRRPNTVIYNNGTHSGASGYGHGSHPDNLPH